MPDIWTISKEDADYMCDFLSEYVDDWPDSPDVECIKRINSALMWAKQINIKD